jgi:hypothetical protein
LKRASYWKAGDKKRWCGPCGRPLGAVYVDSVVDVSDRTHTWGVPFVLFVHIPSETVNAVGWTDSAGQALEINPEAAS